MLGHAEVLGRVGRHQDNAPALVEMAVRLARDEELRARVDAEDAIELLLSIHTPSAPPSAPFPYLAPHHLAILKI